MKDELDTGKKPNWCSGCSDYMLLSEIKSAVRKEIESGNTDKESVNIVTGVGCHGKVFDYMDVGGVYALHGRVVPTATGIKAGNPSLDVIGIAGDGDTYAEGMSHFVHAARMNPDFTLLVFNNEVFALTTGQSTPTTEKSKQTGSQPTGNPHDPVNPLKIALSSGASFVARADAKNVKHTTRLIREAVSHDGFAFIDVAQQCPVYNPFDREIEEKMSPLDDFTGADSLEKAEELAEKWSNPEESNSLPIGVLWKEEKNTLCDKYPELSNLEERGTGWYQFRE